MSLDADIRAAIRRFGPMSVSEFMARCLFDPTRGYYTTGQPLGAAGDFVTAPEISQMFGELVGLWLAQCWLDQGAPTPFVLAELGPGSGQLMADALRATRAVPGFNTAARLTLVDVNPTLKARQAEALESHRPTWAADVSALPEGPLFLVANEFFDCLPINQFVRDGDAWFEQVVALDGDRLAFSRRDAGALGGGLPKDWPDGRVLELCPAANALAGDLARRIAAHGGAALVVDYGGTGQGGDTLQALRRNRKVDPLAEPGLADLTAHVDFQALADTARAAGAGAAGPVPQGAFLERLGISLRARALAQGLSGASLENHIAAHRRLTHPAEMGDLFKALAILPPGAAAPAGFAP